MSESIELRNIQTLQMLQTRIGRFGERSLELLNRLNCELTRTMECVRSGVDICQRKVEARKLEVRGCQEALDRCLSDEDDDSAPDCAAERHELCNALRRLEESRRALNDARILWTRTEHRVSSFRSRVAEIRYLATVVTDAARGQLRNEILSIERYIGVQPGVSRVFELPLARSATPISETPSGDGFLGKLGGEHSEESRGINGEWTEKRISEFELSKLALPEQLVERGGFERTTVHEVSESLRKLEEMKTWVGRGAGNDKESWRQFDRERGLDYSNGYLRVYESYYGSRSIRVVKDGNTYNVDNGRHRIWVAKQLGIRTLPVVLVEREQEV